MICCAKRVSARPRPRPRKSPAGRRIDRAAVKRRAWRTPARVPHQANRYEARSRRGCAAVMIQLRTYVYVDSLQPQLAEYLGTVSQGFLPVPGDACLWLEVSPGMAVHRLTDVALKAARVQLVQQVVERAFGAMLIHHRDQSDVLDAGHAVLNRLWFSVVVCLLCCFAWAVVFCV